MSRRFLDNCLYSVNQIFKQRGRLSHESRYDYLMNIRNMVREWHAAGYQLSNIRHVKLKHVNFLVKQWQENGIATATIKNRLSQLRYLSQLINKPDMMPETNNEMNVGQRSYIAAESKAILEVDLSKFEDPFIQYSVRLQQQFGLRREEAIKFVVSYADRGDHLHLKPSWTKGGVPRDIPILTSEQRTLLDEIKKHVGEDNSLIPDGKTYSMQKNFHYTATRNAGYQNLHGLRHAYAQRRYFEIINERTNGHGWQAPFNGGKHVKDLTASERHVDDDARSIISRELGHSRKQIVAIYCGV